MSDKLAFPNIIRIASAIILNKNKEMLVVRKRNSLFYMLPGGKIEANESLIETLIRELKEELDLNFSAADFSFLGTHEAVAVNESNTIVQGNIFILNDSLSLSNIVNHSEIEEVTWISKSNYQDFQLAHLLEEFALPRWLNDFK